MSAVAALFERTFSPDVPGGTSRLAALGFFVLALVGAGVAISVPEFSHWAGVVLLAAICAAALLFLFLALPQRLDGADGVQLPLLLQKLCLKLLVCPVRVGDTSVTLQRNG